MNLAEEQNILRGSNKQNAEKQVVYTGIKVSAKTTEKLNTRLLKFNECQIERERKSWQ